MIPLILDVDTGIDDAFALLYALGRPEVRLIGVAAVAGNVSLAKAERNTRAVLALAGRDDIPGLAGGARPRCSAMSATPATSTARAASAAPCCRSRRRRPIRRTPSTPCLRRRARTKASLSSSRPVP